MCVTTFFLKVHDCDANRAAVGKWRRGAAPSLRAFLSDGHHRPSLRLRCDKTDQAQSTGSPTLLMGIRGSGLTCFE